MRDCFQGSCLGVRYHIERSSEQLQEQAQTGDSAHPRLAGRSCWALEGCQWLSFVCPLPP